MVLVLATIGLLVLLFVIMYVLARAFEQNRVADIIDWKPTRSPEVEAQNEVDDVRQMIEAQNAYRRKRGAEEITEEDVERQAREDQSFRARGRGPFARLDEERRELEDYFEGRRHEFDVPVDWSLTSPGFRSRALHAVARIPYGRTKTYAEIARAAGNERAFRAAGTACGYNPIPLIVPCHRVVQSGGGIGNYGGGPEMKRALLDLEGAL